MLKSFNAKSLFVSRRAFPCLDEPEFKAKFEVRQFYLRYDFLSTWFALNRLNFVEQVWYILTSFMI